MTGRLFALIAARHDAIEKAAFLQPLIRAGTYAMKRPLQTLGAVFTGQELAGAARKGAAGAGRGAISVPTPSITY